MKVLIACEYSGVVRRAFRGYGHDAFSCDLQPAEDNSKYHIQGDVLKEIYWGWDLMIAHPPCTHLAVSGAMHFYRKKKEQKEALKFVAALLAAPIPRIALENPVSIISSHIRKPDQIVNPWMFGHLEQKKTCFWLKNLPLLLETCNVYEPMMTLPRCKRERLHYYGGKNRSNVRSKTYSGIAEAMASQWGVLT